MCVVVVKAAELILLRLNPFNAVAIYLVSSFSLLRLKWRCLVMLQVNNATLYLETLRQTRQTFPLVSNSHTGVLDECVCVFTPEPSLGLAHLSYVKAPYVDSSVCFRPPGALWEKACSAVWPTCVSVCEEWCGGRHCVVATGGICAFMGTPQPHVGMLPLSGPIWLVAQGQTSLCACHRHVK